MSARLDPELLELLVCTQCQGELTVRRAPDGEEQALECAACRIAYPVEDGIPVMLAEEAAPLGRTPAN